MSIPLSKSWLFSSLAGCLVVGALAACTVSSGPDTDNGAPVKGDDDDDVSSSSSSSGSTSSSSSSGSVTPDAGTCELNDVVDLTDACLTCTNDNCNTQAVSCFCAQGATGTCEPYLEKVRACFTLPEADQSECIDAAQADEPDSLNAYDAYNTCQETNCATECEFTN